MPAQFQSANMRPWLPYLTQFVMLTIVCRCAHGSIYSMGVARSSCLSPWPTRHTLFTSCHRPGSILPGPWIRASLCPTGLWLWNEPRKQQEHTRHLRNVDPEALVERGIIRAARLTAGATAVRLEKRPKGGLPTKSSSLLLASKRLMVKIPDPVVPPRLVTASEVTTLEFLRSELQVPVPKVVFMERQQ